MHPFQQHVKHYAATLITHPMYIVEPTYGSAGKRQEASAARRLRIVGFIGASGAYTSAIAHHLEIGGETMLCFLQKMASDGILTMKQGPQRRCLWIVA